MTPCPPCPPPTRTTAPPGSPFPCASPPFSKPVSGLVANPATWPQYVIPCSHLLDPAYATQLNPNFPFPRQPRAYESETRADGTGLIWGPQTRVAPPPPPPPPPMMGKGGWCTPWTPWNPRAGSCCG